ncbi:hypothetical protein C0995_011063 [Termitomyces sp. Mi166|nr:hypothetical protein C0995_011063 [Termitomyces sp. Mi166\
MAQSTIVPWSSQNGMAVIQNPSGNGATRIYYQPSSGELAQLGVSGPFDIGHVDTNEVQFQIAPAAEVLSGTPIAAAVVGNNTWNEETTIIGLTSPVAFEADPAAVNASPA